MKISLLPGQIVDLTLPAWLAADRQLPRQFTAKVLYVKGETAICIEGNKWLPLSQIGVLPHELPENGKERLADRLLENADALNDAVNTKTPLWRHQKAAYHFVRTLWGEEDDPKNPV